MHSAIPTCVISTSPVIGRDSSARPMMLLTVMSATIRPMAEPNIANQREAMRSRRCMGPTLLVLDSYLRYLASSSRASASSALPLAPRLSMSATQSSYSGAEALTQLSSSEPGIV